MTSIETLQLNRRFDGFRTTPLLWDGSLEELEMFATDESSQIDYPNIDTTAHIRLGKLIEQFVLFELKQDETIELIKSNLQVFRDQITIGELDCLIKQLEVKIHLEIVYKFYLYDPTISEDLNRWVGPNRNDSLVLKLNKLKHKQFPLLFTQETSKLLNDLGFKSSEIKQNVYFKAQLFLPLNSQKSSFQFVNKDCVKGFYMRLDGIAHFENHMFHIPDKLDWLIEAHSDVEWISSQTFQRTISKFLTSHKSPLCWMKSSDGKIQKFFVVWWE